MEGWVGILFVELLEIKEIIYTKVINQKKGRKKRRGERKGKG